MAGDELSVFRKARRTAFFSDPAFGEVRFLRDGERPGMQREDDGGKLPWDACDWFAEEADGAAIGLLKLKGIEAAQRPVATIDDEGTFRVTGLSIADHFAWRVGADAVEREPLVAFCRKAGVPGPHEDAAVARALKKVGLQVEDDALAARALRVSAKTWGAEWERVNAPAPKAAASGSKPKAAAPQAKGKAPPVPVGAFAYGCTGPGGHAHFLVDGKVVRFDGAFRVVSQAGGTSIGALGDLLFVAGEYAPGQLLRDGAWSEFARPNDGGGFEQLLGDGVHRLYWLTREGDTYAWNGSGFSQRAKGPELARRLVHRDGTLYVIDGNHVQRSVGKGATSLPDGPWTSLTGACIAGDFLVCVEFLVEPLLYVLPLNGRARWRPPSRCDAVKNFQWFKALVPLSDGRALLVFKGAALYVIDPATGGCAPAGKRLLSDGEGTTAVLPTADGGAVFVGGTLGIRSTKDPAMLPQLWRAGAVSALPGTESTMAEQQAQQKAKPKIWR